METVTVVRQSDFLSRLIANDVWTVISSHFGVVDSQSITFSLSRVSKHFNHWCWSELRSLVLASHITDSHIDLILAKVPVKKITDIYFYESVNLTAKGFGKVFATLPNLAGLTLQRCIQFSTPDYYQQLLLLTNLEKFHFFSMNQTKLSNFPYASQKNPKGVLPFLYEMKKLKFLEIFCNMEFISSYFRPLKNLSELRLSCSQSWGSNELIHTFDPEDLPSLSFLKLDYSVKQIKNLAAVTSITCLDLGNNDFLPITSYPPSIKILKCPEKGCIWNLSQLINLEILIIRLGLMGARRTVDTFNLAKILTPLSLELTPLLRIIEIVGGEKLGLSSKKLTSDLQIMMKDNRVWNKRECIVLSK